MLLFLLYLLFDWINAVDEQNMTNPRHLTGSVLYVLWSMHLNSPLLCHLRQKWQQERFVMSNCKFIIMFTVIQLPQKQVKRSPLLQAAHLCLSVHRHVFVSLPIDWVSLCLKIRTLQREKKRVICVNQKSPTPEAAKLCVCVVIPPLLFHNTRLQVSV